MLKRYWWVGVGSPHDFSASPSPLRTNWVFKLGWTKLGMGLGAWGLRTKGLAGDRTYDINYDCQVQDQNQRSK